MRKILLLSLCVLMTVGLLSACGRNSSDAATEKGTESGHLKIVTTIFPEYDWVREILGEHATDADLTMLLDSGVDLHSYQPTAEDILKLSTCDLFIYVGGESDEWVEDALKESVNPDMITLNLLEILGDSVKEEEVVDGMQGAEEDEEGPEYDEHVWLSLQNAKTLCTSIKEAIARLDSAHAGDYKENLDAYTGKLDALDQEYRQAADGSSQKTLLFGDRFPFRYLTDDYGLTYYAAFVGCSAETEASFETISFLSQKVDELGLSTVLTIEGTDHKIAETIIENTKDKNQNILSLDSMQSTTAKDAEDGATYLSIMNRNLDILKKSLGETP